MRIAQEFQRAGRNYDIVQVEVMPSSPAGPVLGLIGYDIAQHGWYSMLAWGEFWSNQRALSASPVGSLMRLMVSYFRPLLNENGLFARWSDARFFLNVVEAIAILALGTWKSPGS